LHLQKRRFDDKIHDYGWIISINVDYYKDDIKKGNFEGNKNKIYILSKIWEIGPIQNPIYII